MSYKQNTGIAALDSLTILEAALLHNVCFSTRFGVIDMSALVKLPVASEDVNVLTSSDVESTYRNLATGHQTDPAQLINYNSNFFAYEVLMYLKRIRQDIKDQMTQKKGQPS